jgi:putative addiction module killer protein
MRGYRGLPIRRRRPEFWRAFAVRRLAILGIANLLAEGVSEMRIHYGPGYRVYFFRTGTTTYLLLAGGDKSSQKRDIARAKNMARELRETKL